MSDDVHQRPERDDELDQLAADSANIGTGAKARDGLPGPEYFADETKLPALIATNVGSSDIPTSDSATESSDFGQTANGLEARCEPSLEDTIAQAARWPGLFASWTDKIGALAVAYRLFLLLERHGDVAIDIVMTHPHLAKSKRTPNRKKPAVLALRLVTKPQEHKDHQAVSDWAAMLSWARLEGIDPVDFIERASATSLRACRDYVRNRASKAKPGQGAASDPDRDRNATMIVTLPSGGRKRIVLRLTPSQEEAFRLFDDNRTDWGLTAFVDAILKAST